jgi:hypothetical protein
MNKSKATFWDFLKSPWRNKLAVISLGILFPIILLLIVLEWTIELLIDCLSSAANWVKTWWE